MSTYLEPTNITRRILDAAAEGEGYGPSPSEIAVLAEILTAAAEREARLRTTIAHLDRRIEELRDQVKVWGESVASAASKAAEVAADPERRPSTLGRSSAGAQLDEAITALNTLTEERKMLAYVLWEEA